MRPIAPDTDHGQLNFDHYRLGGKDEPEPLDLIEIVVGGPKPSPGQPENWEISPKPCSLLQRPVGSEGCSVLRAALVTGPSLLGSNTGQTLSATAAQLPASLALVEPTNPRFVIERNMYGQPQPRTLFQLSGGHYNLPITDPIWTARILRKFAKLEPGAYPPDKLSISEAERILFTVSLSEPFKGYCYKLVAGIIVLPKDSHLL